MDGVFIRKKSSVVLILLSLAGLLAIGMYVYGNITGTASGAVSYLLFGILAELIAVPSLLLNRGAYLRADDTSVKAKYHWFGKLDCSFDEIAFVSPQTSALTILLKSGKRHVIMGLENSQALGYHLRCKLFHMETQSPDTLRQALTQAKRKYSRGIWWVIGIGCLMFVNIFLAVALTGGRDLDEFSQLDWNIFTVMGVVELATVVGTFYAAGRYGKNVLPVEQLRYRLRSAVIATDALPSNSIVAVYTDANFTGRIVVCGFPNDESVYYCIQEVMRVFDLRTTFTSKIFDSTDELPQDGFSTLIDITSCF